MSGETDAELQVEVRFIIPRGKTEVSVTECLSLGYDRSREAGHGPVWVTEEEVLALQPSKTVSPVVISNKQPVSKCVLRKDVFVVDPFSGPAFDHISKFKSTIVGPR